MGGDSKEIVGGGRGDGGVVFEDLLRGGEEVVGGEGEGRVARRGGEIDGDDASRTSSTSIILLFPLLDGLFLAGGAGGEATSFIFLLLLVTPPESTSFIAASSSHSTSPLSSATLLIPFPAKDRFLVAPAILLAMKEAVFVLPAPPSSPPPSVDSSAFLFPFKLELLSFKRIFLIAFEVSVSESEES